jgi:hypothetical protein
LKVGSRDGLDNHAIDADEVRALVKAGSENGGNCSELNERA